GRHTAINLDIDRAVTNHRFNASYLLNDRRDEGLPAKAGIDAHHQHEIEPVQDVFDHRFRRMRIERETSLLAERPYGLKRTVEMFRRLGMNCNDDATRFGERLQKEVDGLNH